MSTFVKACVAFCIFSATAFAQVERVPEGTPLPSYAKRIKLDRGGDLTPLDIRKSGSGLPAIMLTGYWPPTNEMLRRFSTDPVQNPDGWIGGDWEGRGYDIYSFFPEFPHGLGKGEGDFEVDYQDTSLDFWLITSQVNPVAIITFGRAYPNNDWELEWRNRNLDGPHWGSDYLAPVKPTPAPPDGSAASGYIRYSSLPMERIVDEVNSAGVGVNAFGGYTGDSGAFLCEFVGYHASWYHDEHMSPGDPYQSLAGGHIHVGSSISLRNAESATRVTVRALIDCLEDALVVNDRIIREGEGGEISLSLDAGLSNANRNYFVLGSVSGTEPGLPLPGGQVTLPLNWDLFTGITYKYANTPILLDFYGTLDGSGQSAALLNTYGPLPTGSAGATMHFAYLLYPPFDFASGPVGITIVP